jgi:predicted ATP-grasp superfamily ATP-dependent carboligase
VRLDGWVVFPTSEESARVLSLYHTELSTYYRVTVPPWETFEVAYDKRLTYRRAQQIGCEIPVTTRHEPATKLERWAVRFRSFSSLRPRSERTRSLRAGRGEPTTATSCWRVTMKPAASCRVISFSCKS